MLLELTMKQRVVTYVSMAVTTLAIYSGFLAKHSPLVQTLYLGLISVLFSGDRPMHVYAVVATFPRDMRVVYRFVKLNLILYLWERKQMSVAKVFETIVERHPHKTALMMEDHRMTFMDVEELSNRIAAYFKGQGFKRGDTIALVMENKPEYACFWLGLSKVGVITALVNNNLRKEVLIHSIRTANSKAIIFGIELNAAIEEISQNKEINGLKLFHHVGQTQKADENVSYLGTHLNPKLTLESKKPLLEDMAIACVKDKMVYIYTSGTTGMPKAAIITNSRYMFMVMGCNVMMQLNSDDIIYNSLPLYHTAGGMLGVGNVLLRGCTMAMRRKFSASQFWSDCIKYECTVAQYIGEICRYLLSVPAKPQDKQHKIRVMFGNGLRPQIWQQFVSRFNVPNIGEVYGSTEGNSNLVNIDNMVGAVGFVPIWAHKLYPVTLVRCDQETGEPIRDATGRCVRCEPGEPGVFIGKINKKHAANTFGGYADKKASEKKILHDVFRHNDAYFNSGDILASDLLGYYYFKDRTGDTFRWRGENVATSEVEAVISNIVKLHDCVVYGIEVPDTEGRAGMAAIVDPNKEIDVDQLANGIRASLPAYARPLFLRFLKELPMTGTFKMKKVDLVAMGFDVNRIQDPIYFLHSDGKYKPFTTQDYDDVMSGRVRL